MAPELGENKEQRALPMEQVGPVFTSAPVDIVGVRGKAIVIQYLVVKGGKTIRRFPVQNVKLNAATATVVGTASGATVR